MTYFKRAKKWRAWMNGWAVQHMHPYERLFAALRDRKGDWYVTDEDELRRHEDSSQTCVVAEASGGMDNDQAEEDAACCFGMDRDQFCRLMLGADGCAYPGCGYEDLARKLRHYLGVQS